MKFPTYIASVLGQKLPSSSRRQFLLASGAIVISSGTLQSVFSQTASVGTYPDPDYLQLDTWIVIHPDNTATFFVGKTDGGQGTGTAFRQMMADELDMAYTDTILVMGRTDITPDQGGSGGSDAIEVDGWPMRRTAAEARRVLLELASTEFGVDVGELDVSNGVIYLIQDPSRTVTYAQLVGGKRFDITLSGANINATKGQADVKKVQDLQLIGQSIQRYDIPPKVDGSLTWAVDMTVPGMVHARHVRPPVAGAKIISVDESSISGKQGFVAVVHRGNYLAVVFEREEQAIAGASDLKVAWQKPTKPAFPSSQKLFSYIREQEPAVIGQDLVNGEPEAAFASAARVIEADYEVPFQGHTAIGPAHAMADPSDGQLTIYSNDMKTYGLRNGVAEFLNLPREKVRVVYMDGPQVYGRTAADDAGFEAAFLAHELGIPVRVQWSRAEETAWDTKGPAFTFRLRGALDDENKPTALEYEARALDYNHLWYNDPNTVLIAQLMGRRTPTPAPGSAPTPDILYAIPNQKLTGHIVSLPQIWETPLRCGNLRDPNGPQVTFAFESFIDEMAAAAKVDPVDFRMQLITAMPEDNRFRRARSLATLKAAAQSFGWGQGSAPSGSSRNEVLLGQGVAYTYRNGTVVTVMAETEVNTLTGRVFVKRLVCAHDCGLVINPTNLKYTVECGMLHGLSRALWEEVQFDEEKVTSTDWISHPTMRHSDTPESIDVIIVNGDPSPDRPDLPHYGAGEASHKPMIAAIANAIFDATGLRLRSVPFRAEKVLAALKEQAS